MQTIELTDKDAERFIAYQKHKNFFDTLIDRDIHKLANAKAVLSFNPQGQLHKIDVNQVVFYHS